MYVDLTLINMGLAFIEGFALIISPCILPILPIILAGGLSGSKARPLGIIIGFVVTFTLVTLFIRVFIHFTGVDPDTIRNISFIMLLLIGVIMVSDYLSDKFSVFTERLANVGSSIGTINNSQSGIWGGILFGGLVAVIWTPCAGPILAAVIVQSIIQQTSFSSVMVVLAFAIGAALPMLLITLIGRRAMNKFGFFRNRAIFFRKFLGIIIILSCLYLIYDSSIRLSFGQSRIPQTAATTIINKIEHPYKAPQIAGISAWINSPPLQIGDLQGKVVLIDFWTYSCINCIRTLPYLKDWYDKYHDRGFEIIGIHSPEFAFEHDLANVKNAVEKYGIKYPVALDNNFTTWQNFHNEYWPAHYLINKEGNVVYEHFGEGEYDATENNIRFLLGLTGTVTPTSALDAYSPMQTPETYLGYARAKTYASPQTIEKNLPANYSYPETLSMNQWALQGNWIVFSDKIKAASAGAAIKLHFHSKKVYAVIGMPEKPIQVKVLLNGQPVIEDKGNDVLNGQITVVNDRLYSLIKLPSESDGDLELIAADAGLEIYTFTFGS